MNEQQRRVPMCLRAAYSASNLAQRIVRHWAQRHLSLPIDRAAALRPSPSRHKGQYHGGLETRTASFHSGKIKYLLKADGSGKLQRHDDNRKRLHPRAVWLLIRIFVKHLQHSVKGTPRSGLT